MCARFEIQATPLNLVSQLKTGANTLSLNKKEVRPTDEIPIITGQGHLKMVWGLRVSWHRAPVINARVETLHKKRLFRPILQNRCTVLTSSYFEWRQDGREKHKTQITTVDNTPFHMAALHDNLHFVIITTQSNSQIQKIHDRMPLILSPTQVALWNNVSISYTEVRQNLRTRSDPLRYSIEDQTTNTQLDLFLNPQPSITTSSK
ncbi:MAG: hypothetical protein CBB68_07990 [Rhodospirillaceae bacterium TMED8]|nr:DUF159 family protein [Magnetovibrio sp.]OUT50916.1 MAG: hypothetical protein CBB68_07990 [Rhodospirillaceae bacterium TMED8]